MKEFENIDNGMSPDIGGFAVEGNYLDVTEIHESKPGNRAEKISVIAMPIYLEEGVEVKIGTYFVKISNN